MVRTRCNNDDFDLGGPETNYRERKRANEQLSSFTRICDIYLDGSRPSYISHIHSKRNDVDTTSADLPRAVSHAHDSPSSCSSACNWLTPCKWRQKSSRRVSDLEGFVQIVTTSDQWPLVTSCQAPELCARAMPSHPCGAAKSLMGRRGDANSLAQPRQRLPHAASQVIALEQHV